MDPKILLIIGALGLVGCLVLLFLGFNMLRDERKAKEAGPAPEPAEPKAPAPAAPAEPEEPLLLPSPTLPPSATASALANGMARLSAGVKARLPRGAAAGSAHEVLRVLRDNLTGRIVVELGGQRYTSLADVTEPELRQALQTILTDLGTFQGSAALEPRRSNPPPERLEAAAPRERADTAPPPARMVTPTPPRSPNPEAKPLPRPTMNPFKQMAVLREMSKNAPPPLKTIAEQIDAVLQDHIRGTPLMERGIKMRPGPRGDAIFDLDGISYTGVEELPDEDVRVVVRAAIAEWEAKQ